MKNHAFVLGLMLMVLGGVSFLARGQNGPGGGAPGTFKPVAPVASLMSGQDDRFKQINDNLGDKKVKQRMTKIATDADILAELANVNSFNRTETDYVQWATEVRDAAMQLANEARKKSEADEKKMAELAKKIDDTCLKCHDKYRQEKPAPKPGR